MRRSMVSSQTLQVPSVAEDPALTPQDVLSHLEAAAVLRDNLITTLGRVLLLCLNDNVRIPLAQIHDAVRNHRVAVYEFLYVLPALRNKLPKQQLYKLLQMLERVDNRFVSEYASLSINALSDVNIDLQQVPLADMLLDIDQEVIESISRDKQKAAILPSLTKDIDLLLRATRDGDQILNLRTVSAILLNYPSFDRTDPEVPNAVRFIARQLNKRSSSEDALLQNMGSNLQDVRNFLKTFLERLEANERSSETIREAASLLLQNFNVEPRPLSLNWKHSLKKLLVVTSDYYPVNVVAAAKYLFDYLNNSHLQDLDIAFYETSRDHALLQVLSRLRRKSHLRHLRKPLSLLIPFVSQKLVNDANHDYTAPISFYEVNDYLDSFDTPCLQQNISDSMKILRPYLSEDLPWTYAFGDRRASNNPWELILTSLIHLRNVPMSKPQAKVIDNFIYNGRVNGLTSERGLLYDSGFIFQREDSMDVEVDLFSLLLRIPNAFKREKFAPMLNFMSKPNILNILGYEFNKFEYDTPRTLLLAMLKKALTLPLVKFDEPLAMALQNAHNYLEKPLLINLYTAKDLQLLLEYLPYINSDPRYLPLKILFKKQKLFKYLSSTFSLANVHRPIERLLLILQTVALKTKEPKLSEALSFAINNIKGLPLPIETFDRSDFVHLVQQLLPRNKTLQKELLNSYAYTNVSDWNISISGTPENVLARTLSYPINYISSDVNLADLTKQAKDILDRETLINTEILRKQTLEAMLEYLPSNTYMKPVILLLRKANLMTLMPKLDCATLEGATARDALIMLLNSLTDSHVVHTEKLLLRRVRVALSSLDGASEDDRQTPIFAYLTQSLQDPSNIIYQPLLLKMRQLQNLTISPDDRQVWLQNYLQQIIDEDESEDLTRAASMILKEITFGENLSEVSRANKKRIGKAISLLPINPLTEPLRKLLTPDWAYSILPEKLRSSDWLENKELLLAILHHAKQRVYVANSPSLMKAISKIEMSLKGWRMNIESLRSTVTAMRTAVYDPVRKLLTAAGLNKFKVTVPFDRSVKISLLELLDRLLSYPVIRKNNNVFKLLSAVRQDVFDFGVDVDLLTVLDDVGISYINELAPIRLFLHRRDVNEKFGRTVFAIANPKKRYRALLHILQKQYYQNNVTQFYDALLMLKNIQPNEAASTMISDLKDIVKAIPHYDKSQFKPIEYLFKADTLSRLMDNDEIVKSRTPLITLLSTMANLPEVSSNYTAVNELYKLQADSERLNYVIDFQLRPLLLELGHVRQINADYLNTYILNPEVLSYLNPEEFLGTSNDNIEILRNIVNYLLYEGSAFVDYDMQKHLQSFKRVLKLTVDSSEPSRDLTNEDWQKMLNLIPHKKDFVPIKIFLQTREIFKYIKYEYTNWKMFSTPVKKLLHLLSLMENNEIKNENVHESAKKLRYYLEKYYNFITERDIKDMHRTLASLKLKYDLVPLKIFLNHDNLNKYLPLDFKYTDYRTSIDAFAAMLDNLLQSSSLKRKVTLYKTMIFVRRSLHEQFLPLRQSFRKTSVYKQLSSQDLEFVSLLNMSLPKVREFLKPEKLMSLLPDSFTFNNQPTFKTKTLHLLRQLLKSDTDVHSELERLLQEVEIYPDVSDITKDDLVPLLNILPAEGIPYGGLIKKYLKPSTLIKLLPGNFDIKQITTVNVALLNVLFLLSVTLGSTKNDQLKIALDTLTNELMKTSSNVISLESIVDSDDIKSVIKEIPFQYKQMAQLKTRMTTKKVVSSLPINFQLSEYKTMKLKVLAVLDELSKSDEFQNSIYSIDFAKRIVSKMPDIPVVNDTEIEKLLLPLPLNIFYVKLLVKNCKAAMLMPYLPIYFNLSSIKSHKAKLKEIIRYCKLANPTDMSTRQALINAKVLLKTLPDVDVTRDHVEVLVRAIPCTHFTSIKPLLRLLSKTDIASLLPSDLDLYQTSRTFKQRIFDLLTALRNVKELQTNEMFIALDSLEMNAMSLPEHASIPQERVNTLNNSVVVSSAPCSDYRDFVLKPENLIQILPPNFHFQSDYETSITSHSEWARLMRFSALFLRDVMDGPMKNAFEACRDNIYKFEKKQIFIYLSRGLKTSRHLVPLRLYALGHGEDIIAPIENVYRAFPYGSVFSMLRVAMREFIRRPELVKSKSLIGDMEVFLHEYLMTSFRIWSMKSKKIFYEFPSPYEIDRAVGEIPSDRKYDDLRILMRCQNIQAPMAKPLLSEDTPKQLLLQMLELAERGDIDDAIRQSIRTFKPDLVNDVHVEEVEYVLKQIRDYRYHASELNSLRKYLVSWGLAHVLGQNFSRNYPTYKDRLYAINDIMLANTINRPAEFSAECRAASVYLNRTLHNEIEIERTPRTANNINMQSLFFALPKTKDERMIRGIIRFFSIPHLLDKLKLPRDPFEYVTKGRLLQAIMDLGQELESVQQDSLQQEALEYFRDKMSADGPSAQPIELMAYAHDSNVDVDMYGVMRAIDYTKIEETDAARVAMFFERKYDNLVHAVGFDHMAYATRGAYLKALFEHLVNVSQVPDDVKEQITSLIPAVRLDGPGEESVDLNTDVADEKMSSRRVLGSCLDDISQFLNLTAHFKIKTLQIIQDTKDLLNIAIDSVLNNANSKGEILEHISELVNVYNKNHIVVGVPSRNNTRRQLQPEQSRIQGIKILATNRTGTKKRQNDRLTKKSLVDVLSDEIHIREIAKKTGHTELKNKSFGRQTQSSNSNYLRAESDNSSTAFEKQIVESPLVLSQKSLSEKRPKKSYQTREKSRRLLVQPILSIKHDADGNATTLHDTSQNEKNLSLTEELIAEQAKLIKMLKIMRKNRNKIYEEKHKGT